jgi:hypothetical protein
MLQDQPSRSSTLVRVIQSWQPKHASRRETSDALSSEPLCLLDDGVELSSHAHRTDPIATSQSNGEAKPRQRRRRTNRKQHSPTHTTRQLVLTTVKLVAQSCLRAERSRIERSRIDDCACCHQTLQEGAVQLQYCALSTAASCTLYYFLRYTLIILSVTHSFDHRALVKNDSTPTFVLKILVLVLFGLVARRFDRLLDRD